MSEYVLPLEARGISVVDGRCALARLGRDYGARGAPDVGLRLTIAQDSAALIPEQRRRRLAVRYEVRWSNDFSKSEARLMVADVSAVLSGLTLVRDELHEPPVTPYRAFGHLRYGQLLAALRLKAPHQRVVPALRRLLPCQFIVGTAVT